MVYFEICQALKTYEYTYSETYVSCWIDSYAAWNNSMTFPYTWSLNPEEQKTKFIQSLRVWGETESG